MGHTLVEFFYHFVWATKRREAYISPEVEGELYAAILAKCKELDVHVYALNGMPDHTHLVCAIPPRLAVADALNEIKGASSHMINHLTSGGLLYWQPGYYGRTFARRELKKVIAYVQNQKTHHSEGTLWQALEIPEPEPVPRPKGRGN